VSRLARHGVLAATLAALAWALAGPGPARAATITAGEFASRLESATGAVRVAASDATSVTLAADAADRVDLLLPVDLRVAEGTATVVVADDSEVHRLTADLRAAADTGQRASAATDLESHLASMERAAASGAEDRSGPAALAALLAARPITTSSGDTWINQQIAKVLKVIADWLGSLDLFNSRAAPFSAGRILSYLVIVVPVLLVMWVVLRARRRRGATGPRQGAASPTSAAPPAVVAAADLPADPLTYAEALAAAGQTRDAVRALYGGAARHLVEAGVVHRMRTRTNHEMLRDVAAASPELAGAFGRLTADFEAAWYGHADPGAPGFHRARESYAWVVAQPGPSATAPAPPTTGPSATPPAAQPPTPPTPPAAQPPTPPASSPPGPGGGPR
jgi:hypothetical protein